MTTFCVPLDGPVSDADRARVGGKARSLLRLRAAGLPVPRAFAIATDLFRALRAGGPPLPATLDGVAAFDALAAAARALDAAPAPAAFSDELARALAGLSARLSVRSSAEIEDRADALGAGIFLSRTDVAADEVASAAREVLGAALAPAVVAYAARRGLPAGELPMAVLVHPFTRGDAAGTAAFDPAAEAEPRVDAAGALGEGARGTIVAAARRLAADGPCELEWVATGDDVLFLQLRPYRAPAAPAAWSGADALADAADWRWDVAHNPLPLSPAQAGLVAFVDARCRTPFRQRVVGGYLFSRADGAIAAPPPADPARAFEAVNQIAKALVTTGTSLEGILEMFALVYEPLFAIVQPAARAAREALAAFLREHDAAVDVGALLAGVPSLATERARRADAIASADAGGERDAAVAAYVARFGDEAPTWDVATPTYAEDPAPLRAVAPRAATPVPDDDAAAARLDAALPAEARAEGRALLAAARRAAAVSEDDDALYARAQGTVRQALLREGRRLRAANLLARVEDVFWLPLDVVRAHARGETTLSASAVTLLLARARQAHADALGDPPPLAPSSSDRGVGVRGRAASAGRAVGRVHLHVAGAAAPAGAILVARTLLPTELPLLSPAALVVETGGPLGHVAAQARERALPAIVDAPGATTAFRAGDLVLVDGDAGVAIRLGD
jgi:pyruvate,water dikinase